MGVSGPSLLIESTDSMIIIIIMYLVHTFRSCLHNCTNTFVGSCRNHYIVSGEAEEER